MAKKQIIDLKNMNLFFEDRKQQVKLITFKVSTMRLDVQIYENDILVKEQEMAFAHLPKKLKSKLNPLY